MKAKEKGQEKKVFPATTQASKDTPKRRREGFPAMTKASRDTLKRRKREEGKRKREKEKKRKREREGGRERERESERKINLKEGKEKRKQCASVQGHTKKRDIPECYIQEYPNKAKREEGEGRGRKGAKVPADSNES